MMSGDEVPEDLVAEAERLGKEQRDLDERNRKRRAKGRKPLPDIQERKDMEVRRRRPRAGGPITVSGEEAIRLFEMRKAQMSGEGDDAAESEPDPEDRYAAEKAQREAESVRRVEDMKAGRIDHSGNWSEGGQKLEGGDDTVFPSAGQAWGGARSAAGTEPAPAPTPPAPAHAKGMMPAAAGLNEFRDDLYERLRVSFEALEKTLSDLQGRVAEIVTASAGRVDEGVDKGGDMEAFSELLSRKSPVVFDVSGTKMTFDAVTVFHAPPCITVVSRSDSATIMPKPGATLRLTYDMDGQRYEDDPVTFLGTRFDLPMFGLSFVGFIRDAESDMMDVEDAQAAGAAQDA